MFTPLPQIMKNVYLDSKDKAKMLLEKIEIKSMIKEAEESLKGKGRLLIRTSGTEPVIRVMVEGQNKTEIENLIDNICESIKKAA